MYAPESLYPSSLLRSEDSAHHLPSRRFSRSVSSKLKLWTAAPELSLGLLEQVWCRIRLTALVLNGGWQGYLMMFWSPVAERFWRCTYCGRTTLTSGVGEVRWHCCIELFLQDYYKWALERGETQGGQKDMNYACVAVADLQFPAAYLNQMDHQHKVCREGWFVFRVPPGI